MAIETLPEPSIPITKPFRPTLGFLAATPIIAVATVCLVLIIAIGILAPYLAPHDPLKLAPALRLKPSSAEFWLGTDAYGSDVLSRIIYGARISLLIGLGRVWMAGGRGTYFGGSRSDVLVARPLPGGRGESWAAFSFPARRLSPRGADAPASAPRITPIQAAFTAVPGTGFSTP